MMIGDAFSSPHLPAGKGHCCDVETAAVKSSQRVVPVLDAAGAPVGSVAGWELHGRAGTVIPRGLRSGLAVPVEGIPSP